jgi:L,D-transpeptidase catalytic domain
MLQFGLLGRFSMLLRLAAALAVAALVFAAPARADLLIQIDKSTQQMTVTADGEQLYTWPVSTGVSGHDTPAGAFSPFRMEKDHYSVEWDDAPMPYSIFFTQKGHAIHGTNHRSLGRPASHGCVRLSVKNAGTLWGLVRKHKMAHTMVVLTGEIPGGPGVPAVARAPQDGDIAADEAPVRRTAPGWRGYADDPRYGRERPYYQRRGLFGGFPFGW